jgi:DNA polymerase-1
MPETAYLIDGTAYIFRSFFGMRPMAAPDGTPINAVFGLGMTLQRFLREHQPGLLACCFDAGARTFRNEMYPDYKANRGEPPAELIPQFDLCRDLTARMGIATLCETGYEADDLLATLTEAMLAAGHEVAIVSGDKDLAQLVGPGVKMYDLARDSWWNEEQVRKKLGVAPAQVADLLALKGDASDNIPGVRGVGPKAATTLLEHFTDLDDIYANLDRVAELPLRGAAGLKKKLEDGREAAELSRRLVELERQAPCRLSSEDLRYRGAAGDELDAFAETWGLGRVAGRVPRRGKDKPWRGLD